MPENPKVAPKLPEFVSPFVSRQSSSAMMRDSTAESLSDRSQSAEFGETHDADVKLTAWIQWTIAKFTVEILSFNRQSTTNLISIPQQSSLKLVFFVEDVVSSLDFQNVYLKIKSKVGSANIQHYVKYLVLIFLLLFVKCSLLEIQRKKSGNPDRFWD